MKIGNWPTSGYLNNLYPELRRLGLESNLAELEAFGFTVIPPQHANQPGLHARALEAVLVTAERRAGVRPDLQNGESHRGMMHPLGQLMRFMLWEDEVFEQLLLEPAMLGIVTWMLGPTCILSLCNAMLRGPGTNCSPLHTDEDNRTLPLLPEAVMTVNATLLLTDYTKEGGAVAFVPGSHRWRREPLPSDAAVFTKQMVPVEAAAGSWVIWGDHTWHSAFPRRIPGLRATFFFNFTRHNMQAHEAYRDSCTQAALDRNPRRFAMLMDQFGTYPWREEDENYARGAERDQYVSLFDRRPTRGSIRLLKDLPPRSAPALTQPTASPLAKPVGTGAGHERPRLVLRPR